MTAQMGDHTYATTEEGNRSEDREADFVRG